MNHATARPQLWLLSTTGLRRIGAEALAERQPASPSDTFQAAPQAASLLAVDDVAAWNAQTVAVVGAIAPTARRTVRSGVEAAGPVATAPHSVLLIDGDLTLVGVLKGPLWRLADAALADAATRWLVGDDAGDRWITRAIRDASGHSALCCAVPQVPLQAALDALQAAGAPTLCALPVWAVDGAAPSPSAATGRRIAAWDGSIDLDLSGTPDRWEDAVLRRPGTDGACQRLRAALADRTVADWQAPLRPGHVETLRFAGSASLRAQALTRIGFSALALWMGVALLALGLRFGMDLGHGAEHGVAHGVKAAADAAAGQPGSVSRPLPPRLPVPEADWRQVEADLQRTWLPLLDRVAASRGPGMEFDRIEPITGDAHGVRLSVQGQAPSAQALAAWVQSQSQALSHSQASPRGAHTLRVRLLGWSAVDTEAGASSARVQFQLEVSDGVRP